MADQTLLPTLLPLLTYIQARDRGFAEAAGPLLSRPEPAQPGEVSASLLDLAHQRLGSRNSALLLADQMSLSEMGSIGLYLASAANLGELLGDAAGYFDLVRSGDTRVALLRQDGEACLTFIHESEWSLPALLSAEVDLGCLLRILRHSFGRDFRPQCIRYPATKVELPSAWERDHGVRAEMAGAHLQLCFPQAALARPTAHPNREIRQALKPSLEARLRPDARGLQQLVAQIVQSGQLRRLDLDSVAALLAMSSATLNRRLSEENTEFANLVDVVSREHALRRLLDSDMTVEALADELGFSAAAEFEQRFVRWLQVSPQQFRQEARAAGYSARHVDSDLLRELPNASRACEVLLGLQNSDDASMSEIADIIGADPVLATRVVGVAGSALYGGRRILSVADAAKVLGMNELRRLAAMMALRQSLGAVTCRRFDLQGYWVASLALATLAPSWLAYAKGCRFDESLALSSLLCEIGPLVYACSAAEQMQGFLDNVDPDADEASLRIAESAAFGTPRYALASLLLARWNVAPEVVRQVRQLDSALDPAANEASLESLALLTLSRLLRRRVQGLDTTQEFAALRAGLRPPAAWAVNDQDDGLEARLDDTIERCREQADMMLAS